MDAALILALQGPPAMADARAVAWRGAWLPVVVRAEAVPAALRLPPLLADERTPPEIRLAAAIAANRVDLAFAVLKRQGKPLAVLPNCQRVLAAWAVAEAGRLGLPAVRQGNIAVASPAQVEALITATSQGVRDAGELLQADAWQRWAGPLVVVAGEQPSPGVVVRPALPIIRVGLDGADAAVLRGRVAAAVIGLHFALADPPTAPQADGWPPWLVQGLGALAMRKAAGQELGPATALELRQRRGADAIAATLTASEPDRELAAAIVTVLVQPAQRAALPNLLDAIRHGSGSAAALQIAYGLTPKRLCEVK